MKKSEKSREIMSSMSLKNGHVVYFVAIIHCQIFPPFAKLKEIIQSVGQENRGVKGTV
jgi:hypothetical protein